MCRYDETIKEREKVKEKEDLSDMVAEHAAKKVFNNAYIFSPYFTIFLDFLFASHFYGWTVNYNGFEEILCKNCYKSL